MREGALAEASEQAHKRTVARRRRIGVPVRRPEIKEEGNLAVKSGVVRFFVPVPDKKNTYG